MVPRAFGSQYGAPRPVKAGTTIDVAGVEHARGQALDLAGTAEKTPSPSRSHCTTAPPMNTLPSSAYSLPRVCAQAVAIRPLVDCTTLSPVCSSMKQPVP